MATKMFDKDTIFDFMVNMAPLAIILFFVVVFTFVNPFGFESLTSELQYTLPIASFALLVALIYLSGKVIAGFEKEGAVYAPGRVVVPGAKPSHEEESEGAAELKESLADDAAEAADETA